VTGCNGAPNKKEKGCKTNRMHYANPRAIAQNGGAPANDDPSFALSIRHGYFSQAFSRPDDGSFGRVSPTWPGSQLQFPRISPLS
jgi:hypothetical protein